MGDLLKRATSRAWHGKQGCVCAFPDCSAKTAPRQTAKPLRAQYVETLCSNGHYTFDMLQVILALLVSTSVPSAAHQHGVDLYKQQKYSEAIAVLQEGLKAEKADSAEYKESMLLIGQSYFMLSQAPKAIPFLQKLPEVNEANYMLGYAYLQSHQQSESEAAFARLFTLKPHSAAAHLVAGQMMLKREYEAQAATELNQALALDPNMPEVHFLLGEIAIFRGRLEEAIENLHKELNLNPNFSMAWYRLGDAYSRQEHWNVAIPNLQRAVWLNPDFSGSYILLGKCYFKTGNWSNAEGILRSALKLDPRNSSATYLLGQTLMLAGKKDEGRAVLEQWKALQQPQQ